MPPSDSAISVIYGSDWTAMTKRLLDQAGIAAAIPQGTAIAVKPNLVVSRPAAGGATTHPEIVAGLLEYLLDHSLGDITIMESSWVGDDTGRAFKNCGFTELAKRYGVKLLDLKKDKTAAVVSPAGKIQICRSVLDAGYLINLPVLKGHCQTRMTSALKNLKGCLPDAEKRRFHREGLDKLIAGLAAALRPDVTLVDNICGDLDFEEGGNPVQANRLFLGRDPFLLDLYGCRLMGLAPEEIGYLRFAAEWGMGSLSAGDIAIIELNRPENAEAVSTAGGKVARLAKRVEADQACSSCFASLIHALQRLENQGLLAKISGIHIGQGWRNKHIDGIGIGDCCRKAEHHAPGCPPDATTIVKFLSARL